MCVKDAAENFGIIRAMASGSSRTVRALGALAAVLVAVALGFAAWRVYRGVRISRFADDLIAEGFPVAYAERLAELKFDHRNWTYVPLPVRDLSWKEVVDKEMTPSWNLVKKSSWAPGTWARLKTANYTPYFAKDAQAYDSGSWYQASRDTVAYFLDPRNFLNECDVFMFEALDFHAPSQTREAVERALRGSFMAEACYDGGKRTFAELLFEVGERLNVSPVFLAGRLVTEQGAGSVQARGTIGDALFSYHSNTVDRIDGNDVWGRRFTRTNENTRVAIARGVAAYNGYYNFFNFRACGRGMFEIKYNAWVEATSEETRKRYRGPWNTQARAIEGGAIKIKERYVDSRRHTRYLQKFSVLAEAGAFRWKQYMQNIAAPLIESRVTSRAYRTTDRLDAPHRFLIPIYRDMPSAPSPDPAGGNSVFSPTRRRFWYNFLR